MKKDRRDKMLSLRVRHAMAHLSHKEHTALLARPNWRRLRRFDMNLLVHTSRRDTQLPFRLIGASSKAKVPIPGHTYT